MTPCTLRCAEVLSTTTHFILTLCYRLNNISLARDKHFDNRATPRDEIS